MAEGQVRYYGEQDYKGALDAFFAAERLAPNRTEVVEFIGHIRRRQGRFDDAFARWGRALELDPYSDLPYTIGQTYFWRREFGEADRYFDLALAAAPGLPGGHRLKFFIPLLAGDTAGARRVIDDAGDDLSDPDLLRAWLALVAREYERAVELDPPPGPPITNPANPVLRPGLIAAALSDENVRRSVADSIRAEVERARDSLPYSRFGPARAEVLSAFDDATLAIASALEGNYAAARERLATSLRVYGFAADALVGYRPVYRAAFVEILAGDSDRAIEYLETLLANPSPISVGFLEVVPLFDSLRDEPEFQRLLEQYR